MDLGWFYAGVSIVLLIIVFIGSWLDGRERLNFRLSKLDEEYVEYETESEISEKWYCSKLNAECSSCGMDDAPIVDHPHNLLGNRRCKFCVELTDLTRHLAKNGVRRFKRVA